MPVIDYKCPNCGSSMMFDSATGMLACPSCGRKDDIEQMPDPTAIPTPQQELDQLKQQNGKL